MFEKQYMWMELVNGSIVEPDGFTFKYCSVSISPNDNAPFNSKEDAGNELERYFMVQRDDLGYLLGERFILVEVYTGC